MKNHVKASLAVAAAVSVALSGCTAAASPAGPGVVPGQDPGQDVLALPENSIDTAVEQLPGIVADVLERTGVPGMSVAVVQDGEVVFADGFGVREAGTGKAVTADTVFQLASLSKPLSATGVAAAIGQPGGSLGWDTPIHTLLPDFAYSDAAVTGLATVGDAFSHRTGLATGAGDDLEDIGFGRQMILDRLRLQPLDSFRTSYHYSNYGLTVGAEAVAESRGQSWDALMDELVFGPIGMESSSARHADYLARDNRALLHAKIDGEFVAAYDRDPDAQAPAGGVSSTVNDLARWMTVLLQGGALEPDGGGARIADAEALAEAMSPQIVSNSPQKDGERPSHYGHGFNANPLLSGRMASSHSGAFVLGAGTAVQLVPQLGLGIVALGNGAPVGAPESVTAQFMDLVQFGESTRDWTGDLGSYFAALLEPVGDLVGKDRPAGAAEPQDVQELAGMYASPYFGEMTIEQRSGGLIARLGPDGVTEIELEPWDGDTFGYVPAGENAPYGSHASAAFDRTGTGVTVVLQSFDGSGLGTWTKGP